MATPRIHQTFRSSPGLDDERPPDPSDRARGFGTSIEGSSIQVPELDQARRAPSMAEIGAPPIRVVLINEDIQEDDPILPRRLRVLLNPPSLRMRAGAEWVRIAVPGLSHEVLQYSRTRSVELQFELYWSLYEATRQETTGPSRQDVRLRQEVPLTNVMFMRDFLTALVYPLERGSAPSRVSVVWPSLLALSGVITDVDFEYRSFDKAGGPLSFAAQVQFVELREQFRERNRLAAHSLFDAGYTPAVRVLRELDAAGSLR